MARHPRVAEPFKEAQMRKLIVVNMMSLDGFYEGPDKNLMALPFDEAFDAYNLERVHAADIVMLGGNSYEGFKSYWPDVEHDASMPAISRDFSRMYNDVQKVVVSDHTSLPEEGHPWATSTRIVRKAEAHAEIAKLKGQDGGEIVVWGSRTLWNDLLARGLIDELHLIIGPVALGDGTPLFKHRPPSLRCLGSRTFDGSDNALVRYQVLGET